MSTLFTRLNAIDCSKHVEKKGKFSYLSWTWAWQMLKEECPDATFEKHTFLNNEARHAVGLERLAPPELPLAQPAHKL